jgi:hypothetical protein
MTNWARSNTGNAAPVKDDLDSERPNGEKRTN